MARKSFSVLFFIKKGKLLKASILDKYSMWQNVPENYCQY